MKKVNISIKKQHKTGYTYSSPLPFPSKEMFDIPAKVLLKAVEAERLLGKLDGITLTLPDINFFLKMFSYKDATSSSQIEGTLATFADALEASAEISNKETDASDILYYIKALNYGVKRSKEFPISLRLIKEIHQELMQGARSTHFSDPGNFRTSQNWIGGTRPDNASFVPVPPEEMNNALHHLEDFLHNDSYLKLITIAYIHAQFETIHPFLDGNGRVGRLLITFLLMEKKVLDKPVLFLSSFFKEHQKLYYQRLDGYHNGEVFPWLDFFLDGVIETANKSIQISTQVRAIRDRDMEKIQALSKRESESGVKVLNFLFQTPIVTTKSIMKETGFTRAGAQGLIDRFVKMNILKERPKNVNYDVKYFYEDYYNTYL